MMRYSIIFIILLFIVACVFPPLVSADQNYTGVESDIHFIWSFGVIKNRSKDTKSEPISGDTTLETGDKIKFLIDLEKRCFVYLLYYSSQGELSTLFPFRFKPMAVNTISLDRFYIPENDLWFELDDHTGKETFYLLASENRLYELENLINIHESTDKHKKKDIAEKIFEKIKRLRKQHTKLKAKAERPIEITGNKRGVVKSSDMEDLIQHAVEIKADDFYFRTYEIDHK